MSSRPTGINKNPAYRFPKIFSDFVIHSLTILTYVHIRSGCSLVDALPEKIFGNLLGKKGTPKIAQKVIILAFFP